MYLTPIREILGLNLIRSTGHSDRFCGFPQCLQDNFGIKHRLGYDCVLPNHLHLNIYYHPMILALRNVDTYSFRK
jgi:hypothetical protein